MNDIHTQRLANLRSALTAAKIDAVLLTNMVNIAYITGFTGSAAHALISNDNAVFLTDTRYTLRANREVPLFQVETITPAGYTASLKTILENLSSINRIGFESSHITMSQYSKYKEDLADTTGRHIEFVATDSIVEDLRAVKDIHEIAKIRHAVTVAERAFNQITPYIHAGKSERVIAAEIDHAMRLLGAEAPSFETIIASGLQSAHPHHRPNERVLEPGDWVTIDWGALVNGYCSDITRTVIIGDPTDEQRKIYHIVLEAQQKAIDAIAPGKTGAEIDAIARDHITAAGYGDKFGHSLGHALGRVVHDGPGFSSRTTELILKPGMVMTVEPGIYIEGWGGIRIEEDIVVTENGCEVLTHLPRELTVF